MRKDHSLLVQVSILGILLLGLVGVTVASHGRYFFYLEGFGFLVLIALGAVGLFNYSEHWGKRVLLVFYLLYAVNGLLIWYFKSNLYVFLVLLGLAGLFLVIFSSNQIPAKKVEPHSVIFDQPVGKPKAVSEKPKVVYDPGKYVASKNSNVYHEPKCEWAKKIAPARQVWFGSSEEAWSKGYKGHGCVQ